MHEPDPVNPPSVVEDHKPCFELYDERNQYKIEQCCEGKPDAADICNHIRRGGTYLDCRSGRRSDYYDVVPVNAPSEIVDESQEIERLKADRDHWKQSATSAITERNDLKAELAALREPQRDTRTRVGNGKPKSYIIHQLWDQSGDPLGFGYTDGSLCWYRPYCGDLISGQERVEFWRPPNWSHFAPIPEPIYAIATDGMPKEADFYWIEIAPHRWHLCWYNKELGEFENLQDWDKTATKPVLRYQRIRPPEVEK